ncbi:MAG: dihydrodipicolinate synthase family protein, partial [Candidatus Omnitrophica bacterium]|nr:dihydrodipicolinate synthase family protein [Candidatus Omnitrophota bacterium]
IKDILSIFVGENYLADAMKLGAKGSYSSLIYMNPPVMLNYFKYCQEGKWEKALSIQSKIRKMDEVGLDPFTNMGYTDTAYDRLQGLVNGFLKTSMNCRKPYRSTCKEDIKKFREWLVKNIPEFLASG